MRINFETGRPPSGVFARFCGLLIGAATLAALLMASLVLFVVVAVVGVGVGIYFWWKTRALRKVLRDEMRKAAEAGVNAPHAAASEPPMQGEVIDGEAVRVPDDVERLPK